MSHSSKVNCVEMSEDGPGEPAYEFFVIVKRIFNRR